MVHTFEVLVDIKEFAEFTDTTFHNEMSRYEINAESKESAKGMARIQAKSEHPKGTEYDVRVIRLLR